MDGVHTYFLLKFDIRDDFHDVFSVLNRATGPGPQTQKVPPVGGESLSLRREE